MNNERTQWANEVRCFGRKGLLLLGMVSSGLSFLAPSASAGHTNPLAEYKKMKYGLFVHYVWGGEAYSVTVNKDGGKPAGLDDLAGRFDAEGFARDVASMNVEYVLFTAWHANMNLLYPGKAMDRWISGHTAKRDLIGDMIKACKAKGVQVLLYTHPRDGHDLTVEDQVKTGWGGKNGVHPAWDLFDKKRWNDFINDVYAELIDRYGNDILGLYLDEGSGQGDSYKVVDYPRLRETIKSRRPDLVMMQNFYGNLYSCDIGNKEVYYGGGPFGSPDGTRWPGYDIPISIVVGSIFWAAFPEGKTEPAQKEDAKRFNKWIHYTPEAMFRYTVFQAAANRSGGGTIWAAGPYPGGGWEHGVLQRMQKTGALIKPIEESVKATYPSSSFVTLPGTTISQLAWGVATRSADDNYEYIHVLTPPKDGNVLLLGPSADGKVFDSVGMLLPGNRKMAVTCKDASWSVSLPDGCRWDPLDTVIRLTVRKF